MDLILYHKNCPDGFTAAYVAKLKYPEAELVSMDHGADHTETLKQCAARDVLMVDFSLRTREENDTLAASTRSFQILDHHKTAQAVPEGASYAVFDMNRSGAGLTFDYLFGANSDYHKQISVYNPAGLDNLPPLERPWWVSYVEDRDLWRFNLPNSKEINAYIMTFPYTLEGWKEITRKTLGEAVEAGKSCLLQVDHYVREAVKQAQFSTWEVAGQHYSVAVLNVPYLNCSEVGNVLAGGSDVSVTWFERGDSIIQFSLRSKGEIDVSAVAKSFNGGGHKNAAGFQLPLAEGRKILDQILKRA